MDLYQKMIDGTLTDNEKKELHDEVISQHEKQDTPNGLYKPDECPCSYGICDECIKG